MNPNQNPYQNSYQGVTNYTNQSNPQNQNQLPMNQGQPTGSNMVQPQSSAVQIPPGGNQFLYGVQPVVQRQSLDSSGGSSDFMTGWGNSNLSAGTNVTRYSTSSGSNPASQNSSAGWNQDPSSAGTRGINGGSAPAGGASFTDRQLIDKMRAILQRPTRTDVPRDLEKEYALKFLRREVQYNDLSSLNYDSAGSEFQPKGHSWQTGIQGGRSAPTGDLDRFRQRHRDDATPSQQNILNTTFLNDVNRSQDARGAVGVNKSLPPATMNNTFPRQGPPAANAPADYVPIMDFNFNWSAPQIVLPGPEAQGSSPVGISNSPNSAAGGNITTSSPVGNANHSLVPLNLTVSPIAGNLGYVQYGNMMGQLTDLDADVDQNQPVNPGSPLLSSTQLPTIPGSPPGRSIPGASQQTTPINRTHDWQQNQYMANLAAGNVSPRRSLQFEMSPPKNNSNQRSRFI